jgi:dephospho-CoA kinase
MEQKIVVGIAGMPGAGKAVVSRVAHENDYAIVIMGDVIREETKRRGLKLTPENVGKVMVRLREEKGQEVVAKRCIPKISNTNADFVLVDGIRSLIEVQEFKKSFKNFALVAVHSSPETRFGRVFRRKRSDDPSIWEVFHERDLRELSVGQGNVIAMADYMIANEGTFEEYKAKIKEVLEAVKKKWTR